ncbi:hypothetical protein PGTUg99_012549, partial [Puccinia graminis f. sp. tritici]
MLQALKVKHRMKLAARPGMAGLPNVVNVGPPKGLSGNETFSLLALRQAPGSVSFVSLS